MSYVGVSDMNGDTNGVSGDSDSQTVYLSEISRYDKCIIWDSDCLYGGQWQEHFEKNTF